MARVEGSPSAKYLAFCIHGWKSTPAAEAAASSSTCPTSTSWASQRIDLGSGPRRRARAAALVGHLGQAARVILGGTTQPWTSLMVDRCAGPGKIAGQDPSRFLT